MHRGRAVFGAMRDVVLDHPATEAAVGQIDRRCARAFPIIRGKLNRETSAIERDREDADADPRNLRKIGDPAQTREILRLAA